MYQFSSFSLDPIERVVLREGMPLSLTPKVFDTLLCFVQNPGRVITKDELLQQIWPDTFVEEVNLAVNISILRKLLGETAQDPRYILTVPGRGYRFVAEVQTIETDKRGHSEALPGNFGRDTGTAGSMAARQPARTFTSARTGWVSVLLVLCLFIGFGWYHWRDREPAPDFAPASIAVLPFADLSPKKDQEYFADGLAQQLIDELSKISSLKVVALSSTVEFKGKNQDLRSIGRELGVRDILEGSVRKEGNRVRISAELVNAEDGYQLWAESFDRKVGDIFLVQEEIARSASKALRLKLLSSMAREQSTNPEAYDAFLRAQYFTTRGRDKADLENAFSYAEKAIKLDEGYASAWALRSYVFDTMGDVGQITPASAFSRAREDAERAIELDPNSGAGYLALAWVQMNRDWNWDGAELSLKKAEELEPGSASVLRYRSFLCHSLGRLHEAIRLHQQALALDPLFASSHSYLAFLLYAAGEYEKAAVTAKEALQLNPQKTYDHFTLGEVFLAQGYPQRSLAEMQQEPAEIWRLTGEALAYYALRRSKDSDSALTELIDKYQQNMAYQIAEVYAYRGDSEQAFNWLTRAYEQRDSGLRSLKVDPLLTSLRRDPRYMALLTKMRLGL